MSEEKEASKSPQWDLRRSRVQQIGHRVGETEESLNKVYRDKTLEAAEEWFAAVRTLWSSIKHYIESEGRKDEVEEMISDFHERLNSEEPMQQLKTRHFKDLHEKVHEMRITEAGMDIPMQTDEDGDVEDFYL